MYDDDDSEDYDAKDLRKALNLYKQKSAQDKKKPVEVTVDEGAAEEEQEEAASVPAVAEPAAAPVAAAPAAAAAAPAAAPAAASDKEAAPTETVGPPPSESV